MSLLYCGIDEAGYGPLLGPLCVALAAFEIDDWNAGEPAPDLWQTLSSAVSRSIKGAGARIPIADSKKLKLSNQGKRDPLTHLERGVLATLAAWHDLFETDEAFFDALGTRLEPEPWYQSESIGLPRSTSAQAIRIDSNALLRAGRAQGVRLVGIWCFALCEQAYNQLVAQYGTKAATTALASRTLIRRILEHEYSGQIRIVGDRQGGRQHYQQSLSGLAGCGQARVLEETERLSRYELDDRTVVSFMPEAEDHHLPVALASMTAKLVRELAMARFNRYWSMRLPGLRATAGYTTDARRWLEDAGPALDQRTRAMLIRRA